MWARFISVVLGIWLVAAPDILAYAGFARLNGRIVGPVVASIAIIAIWEVTRPLRWVNFALGTWLVVAPWAFGYALAALVNSIVVGAGIASAALVRGKIKNTVGNGWSSLWKLSEDDQGIRD